MALGARVQGRRTYRSLRGCKPVRRRRLLGSPARTGARRPPLGSIIAFTPPAFAVLGDGRRSRGRAGGGRRSRDRAGPPERNAESGRRARGFGDQGHDAVGPELEPAGAKAGEARYSGKSAGRPPKSTPVQRDRQALIGLDDRNPRDADGFAAQPRRSRTLG